MHRTTLGAAVMLLTVLGAPSPVAAATLSWSAPVDLHSGALLAVSCPSASFCVAVGGDEILTSDDPAGGSAAWKVTPVTVPRGR